MGANYNYKNTLRSIFFIIAIIFFASCSESEKNAQKITLEDIYSNKVRGYDWFDFEYQDYNLNKDNLQDIRSNFNVEAHKILIYTSPSCSCGREFRKFPAFIKILDSAGISKESYEIYSIGDRDFSHPYKDLFKINIIPSFIVLHDNAPVYSINDTILKYTSSTSNDLETRLLEALKKTL